MIIRINTLLRFALSLCCLPTLAATVLGQPRPEIHSVSGAGSRPAPHQNNPQPEGVGTPLLMFPGISADGQQTPDTSGAVGDLQFVQWVNVEYAVYNKASGVQEQGPTPGNNFWSAAPGSPCSMHNDGQPVVEFDKTAGAAGQWVVAQQVLESPYYYCIAVSQTDDATGAFYPYAFQLPRLPAGEYPYYAKLAVWPDAYYASFNILNSSGKFVGALVAAFDRTNMIAGGIARSPIFFGPKPAGFAGQLLPSDFDGTVAPAPGEPNLYLGLDPNQEDLDVFQFHTVFGASGSTFTETAEVPIAPYQGCSSNPPQWCVAERSPGRCLESIGDRLMFRLAWHNVAGTEYLVTNHTIMTSPGLVGVDWYAIANPSTSPSIAYSGTVSDPKTSYWIGSIAMDHSGDIALGFSAASKALDPSIEYTGCAASGSTCTTTPPLTIVKGTGVQENSTLWGEYSQLSVDPIDDCTLWYTNEYIAASGSSPNWNTEIASFKFDSCVSPPPAGLR
jgi:hypothetical protein